LRCGGPPQSGGRFRSLAAGRAIRRGTGSPARELPGHPHRRCQSL